jgi:PAC2 family
VSRYTILLVFLSQSYLPRSKSDGSTLTWFPWRRSYVLKAERQEVHFSIVLCPPQPGLRLGCIATLAGACSNVRDASVYCTGRFPPCSLLGDSPLQSGSCSLHQVLPCAGNDAFEEAGGELVTALELYAAPGGGLFVLQQRAPVALGRQRQFAHNLVDWCQRMRFSEVGILLMAVKQGPNILSMANRIPMQTEASRCTAGVGWTMPQGK